MQLKFFDSIIMLRFAQTKVGKEEFYAAKKFLDADADNTVISKLIKTEIIICI